MAHRIKAATLSSTIGYATSWSNLDRQDIACSMTTLCYISTAQIRPTAEPYESRYGLPPFWDCEYCGSFMHYRRQDAVLRKCTSCGAPRRRPK